MSNAIRRWAYILGGALLVHVIAHASLPGYPLVDATITIGALLAVYLVGAGARLAWGPPA